MKYFKILILCKIVFLLFSCGAVREGFSNQKKNNSDEFLVEKKSPLVMPPDYNDLPLPKIDQIPVEKKNNEIQILISKEDNEISTEKDSTDKNFEENLMKKIKKN